MENYFQLYELPQSFHPDPAFVKRQFFALSRQHHPDRFTQASMEEQTSALQQSSIINKAYKTLKDADSTMGYLLRFYGILEEDEKYALPPEFLMEMMELNEAMEEGDSEVTQRAIDEAMTQWEKEVWPLTTAFEAGDCSRELLLKIKDYYFRKKYLLRLLGQGAE